jgi:hypothetical protein
VGEGWFSPCSLGKVIHLKLLEKLLVSCLPREELLDQTAQQELPSLPSRHKGMGTAHTSAPQRTCLLKQAESDCLPPLKRSLGGTTPEACLIERGTTDCHPAQYIYFKEEQGPRESPCLKDQNPE